MISMGVNVKNMREKNAKSEEKREGDTAWDRKKRYSKKDPDSTGSGFDRLRIRNTGSVYFLKGTPKAT